jgi:hypothetical protein
MGVGEDFQSFCSNLTVNNAGDISSRYKAITKRLNLDFWNSDSDTNHSYYIGSYGRGTAIRGFHDMDVLFRLPYSYYEQYNGYSGNGQSALLQAVKNSIQKTYSNTDVGGDGQVVVVRFTDEMRFEVLPAFINKDASYTYPNSNNGGSWKTTNPFPEIEAINKTDTDCNFNLKWLCRMTRSWKRKWDVPMGGLLVDTLANSFIKGWTNRDKSYLYYDWMSRDFFDYLANQSSTQQHWVAPGSGQYVYRKGNFEYKARQACNLAKEAITYATNENTYSARQKWREIYGTSYPG